MTLKAAQKVCNTVAFDVATDECELDFHGCPCQWYEAAKERPPSIWERFSDWCQHPFDALPEWVCDLIGIFVFIGLVIASPFSERARKLVSEP